MKMAIPYCVMNASLISAIMFYSWSKNKLVYMKLWAIGWGAFVIKCLLDHIYFLSGGRDVYLVASLCFMFITIFTFDESTYQYSNSKPGKWRSIYLFGPAILVPVFSITGNYLYANLFFAIMGGQMVLVAHKMYKNFTLPLIGRWLTFVGNAMIGVLMIFSVFLSDKLHFGETYYVLSAAAIIINSAGLAFVYYEDGFRKLKAENKEIRILTEKLERDRFLLDQSSDAIFVCTIYGDIIEVNETAVQRYEYTKEELLKMNVSDIRRGTSQDMLLLQMKYYAESHELHNATHYSKSGKIIPVEAISTIVKIGEIEYIVNAARDISERIKAESEFMKLSRAVEQSGSVVVITDQSGSIEYVNPKFSAVTGYLKEEVLGKNTSILKAGLQSKSVYEDMWNTIRQGHTWVGEIQNLTKAGDLYWAFLNITPVKNAKDEITNFIAVQENITELKELQRELIEKNSEMKALLDQLSSTQVQMIQQEKLAGIGHLAAGIAHEINNPLGYVSSNIETLKKFMGVLSNTVEAFLKDDTEMDAKRIGKIDYVINELPEMLSDIENGLERIRTIVQSLRNFSRVDSMDSRQEYDLNEGIRDTINIAYNEFKYIAKLDLQLGFVPIITANGGQLNQTLLNLVINSGQALKEKFEDLQGIIRITTHSDEEYIYCVIEDNGPGVPEELREKIFMPFFTTKPIGKGTGLGLGIVYDIIATKHNGSIQVCTSDLGGAKFSIRLPIKN